MAKLYIDDVEYEAPTDFDLGEARIIKRYADVTLNQLRTHDDSDPDLVAAFIHIAFRRATPEASYAEIERRVDAVKLAKIDLRDEETDARPPELATSPLEDSPPSSGESSSNGAATIPEPESLETSGHPV